MDTLLAIYLDKTKESPEDTMMVVVTVAVTDCSVAELMVDMTGVWMVVPMAVSTVALMAVCLDNDSVEMWAVVTVVWSAVS